MKKILYNYIYYLKLFSVAGVLVLMSSCKDEIKDPPVITGVRNYASAPDDTVIQTLVPDQWVVLEGRNLKDAVQISFNGVPAEFNSGIFADNYAVVHVPAVIPFPSVPADKLNTIQYVTMGGETTYNLNIVAPPPTLLAVSNENPNPGDRVIILGTNLFLIEEITFAGASVDEFIGSDDGTMVALVIPELTQSGPIVVTTKSGVSSTIYNVNDVTTGVLCNFDDISPIGWGGYGATVDSSNTRFPSNRGKYGVFQNDILSPYDWAAWNGGRIVILDAVQWLPEENLNDPLDNWAVKFEINVPGEWNGNTIFVSSEHNDYRAVFEPWKNSNGTTSDFTTKGQWITVTVPFSGFYKGWTGDEGDPVTSITDLIGDTGTNPIAVQTMNVADGPTATGLEAGIDNIRVIKIK